jgi:hypothetical protein
LHQYRALTAGARERDCVAQVGEAGDVARVPPAKADCEAEAGMRTVP